MQVDGQLKTGRDVVIGALLGAEEFGFATAPLVVSGCIMMRVCHLDTCPVGVATQNPVLRARFNGKPEFVVNFMEFIAQEVREYLAELGFRSLDEAIGRSELLDVNGAVEHWKASGLDLVADPRRPGVRRGRAAAQQPPPGCTSSTSTSTSSSSSGAGRRSTHGGARITIDLPIRNTERAVGTLLGHDVTRAHERERAAVGQRSRSTSPARPVSRSARSCPPASRCGSRATPTTTSARASRAARSSIRPPRGAAFAASQNVIAGNVHRLRRDAGHACSCRGVVGERFLVRNSGATAVVEGVGDHALEYMTGGLAVILGATGRNLGAGMSGGTAYVYGLDREARQPRGARDRRAGAAAARQRRRRRSCATCSSSTSPRPTPTLAQRLLDDVEATRWPNFVRVHAARLRRGAADPPGGASPRGSTPTATSSGTASWR